MQPALSPRAGLAADRRLLDGARTGAASLRVYDLAGEVGSGDERVRRAAAAALGALGERSAPVLAALRAASVSADPSLRRAAAGALRQLGAESARYGTVSKPYWAK